MRNKITYVSGDLFETHCRIIAHGCNARGVMNSGVAKIVRSEYPGAYEQYRNLGLAGCLTTGHVDIYVAPDSRIIANLITQSGYGYDGERYVSYDAVATACDTLDKHCARLGITEVAMPRIGAGLGGGNWEVIEAIIETSFAYAKPIVYTL